MPWHSDADLRGRAVRVHVPLERRVPDVLLAKALASNRKPSATRTVYHETRLADSDAAVDRLVAANLKFTAAYYARNWALLSASGRRRLRRTISPVAEEHLRRATDGGQGALLLAIHLGDFDLAGHWLASELGRDLVVASPSVRPAWRGALYTRSRSIAGFRVRPQERTTLDDLARDLRNGHLVLFLADRRCPGRSVPARFFGRPSSVSAAPAWLSASTGAPVMTAATYTEGPQDRRLVFGVPRWAHSPGDHCWTMPALAELEASVHRAPHQWHIPADLTQMAVDLEAKAKTSASVPGELTPAI
ncbi:MAG: lysophospholipid acyltransferase family protein [Solirubrobacteraceae bacterium]